MKLTILTIISIGFYINTFAQSISLEPNSFQLPRYAINPGCTVNDKGKVIYNTSLNKVLYCNGVDWVSNEGGGSNADVTPAFSAYNTENLYVTQTLTGISFNSKTFDLTNNMMLDSEPANSNKFIAPVSGVYHFDFSCILYFSNFIPNNNTQLVLLISRLSNSGGNAYQYYFPIKTGDDRRYVNISKSIELKAGEAVNITKTINGAPNTGSLQLANIQLEGFLAARK